METIKFIAATIMTTIVMALPIAFYILESAAIHLYERFAALFSKNVTNN